MLLQLEEAHKDDINKLLAFAKENHLKPSLVDDCDDYVLPGQPLTNQQLKELIEASRKSGTISMKDAHQVIVDSYNAH